MTAAPDTTALARRALELRCKPHSDVPTTTRLAAFYDALARLYGDDFAYAVGNEEARLAAEGGR